MKAHKGCNCWTCSILRNEWENVSVRSCEYAVHPKPVPSVTFLDVPKGLEGRASQAVIEGHKELFPPHGHVAACQDCSTNYHTELRREA